MDLKENYSLKEYNTFGIDVRCSCFVKADREDELLEFVKKYDWDPLDVLILGGGSNFLFTEDFDGTVFYPAMRGIEIVNEDESSVFVRVGAGEEWDDFVAWAVEHGYGGVENLSLIPGHVGAAPVQNVGAYGMEAADTIYKLEAISLEDARIVKIDAEDCQFSYRDSIFKRECKNRYVITSVTFRLSKVPEFRLDYGNVKSELERLGGGVSLCQIRQAIINIRNEKLPDVRVLPNAGSFFKNPVIDNILAERILQHYPEIPVYTVDEGHYKLAAGWMIEQCGWKGMTLGRAGVHDKQALVLVNRGGADGTEISRLANEIKKSVFMKFGVWIEPEVYVL